MIDTDVTLSADGYGARFRRDLGATCYSLTGPGGEDILRAPADERELKENPFLFGNPILFPPNRISGGSFVFEGRKYSFPVNERETGAHLHGELYRRPFRIEKLTSDSVSFVFSAEKDEYLGFPHTFEICRHYCLCAEGLIEDAEICNHSGRNMPFMLAFHTTFRLQFDKGNISDYRLSLPVGREEIRDGKYLPTGEWKTPGSRELRLSKGEYIPDETISAFYESKGSRGRIFRAHSSKAVCYEADENYRYRMLWKRANDPFVVIEPQTAAIDCFHLPEGPEKYGLLVIPPSKKICLRTRIGIEKS